MKAIAIREAPPDALPSLAGCLARAFESDPVIAFLFPRAPTRIARAGAFFLLLLRHTARSGVVYTDERRRGASLWNRPGVAPPAGWPAALGSLRMAAVLREAAPRGRALFRAVRRARPAENHWHLDVLGVDPPHHRKGLGSALLRPVLDRCDETGTPACLDTRIENIPFYERHDFERAGVIDVSGGPRLCWMRRAARRREPSPRA